MYKLKNPEIINDRNFDRLFKLMRTEIFNDNISKIISSGYSERLLQLIEKNPYINRSKINLNLFDDHVWKIISENPTIGDKTTLEFFNVYGEVLIDMIKNNLFEGLKYTYENIPESQNFIIHSLSNKNISIIQFDLKFINDMGDELLSKLYSRHCFSNKSEFSKIFKIHQAKNCELIQDIVNYDPYNCTFKWIPEEDIEKSLFNINTECIDKQELLVNKFFGIELNDHYYIKLFLATINKAPLSPQFREKYGTILELLNKAYSASDEEIIEMSKKLDQRKKENYRKLIYNCEREGNELIKGQFSKELEQKNTQILNEAHYNPLTTDNGDTIDIYELTGQPFTMLVHAITDNPMSVHNSFVSEIINNPENWNKIDKGNNYISTSLISDKYMVTYDTSNDEETVMFGFYQVPASSIKLMSTRDAGMNRLVHIKDDDSWANMRNRLFVPNINTVVSIEELMDKTIENNSRIIMWNEIGVTRSDEETGKKLQPNYIVCMDYISEKSKKAAKHFGIPIYLIHRKYYKKSSSICEDDLKNKIHEEGEKSTGIHK